LVVVVVVVVTDAKCKVEEILLRDKALKISPVKSTRLVLEDIGE
jgi:hypothetical protein